MRLTEPHLDVDDDIVVLTGPEPVPSELIEAMVARLRSDHRLDAVGVLEPVVDAVKVVGPDRGVVEALDRTLLGHLGRPLAVRRQVIDPGSGDVRVSRLGVV